MKKIVSMLLAAVLSMGMLAGCGEKMTAEEQARKEQEEAYKETCLALTNEEMLSPEYDDAAVVVSGTIVDLGINSSNEPYIYIGENGKKRVNIYYLERLENFDIGEYKEGMKINVWGDNTGMDFDDEKNDIPAIEVRYIEKVK